MKENELPGTSKLKISFPEISEKKKKTLLEFQNFNTFSILFSIDASFYFGKF